MNTKVMIALVLLLQSFSDVISDGACDCTCEEPSKLWTYGVPAVGVVAGAAVTVVGAPVVLTAAGFGATGIAAGSVGAKLMSLAATYGYGMGIVSSLQAAGAAGVGFLGTTLSGALGGVVGVLATPETKDCSCCQKEAS